MNTSAQLAILSTIIIFLFPSSAFAQADWEWRNPLPQGNTLTDVCFIDSTTIVAVGYGGALLWSTDTGLTWEVRPTGLRGGYNAVEATADGRLLFSWEADRLLRCSGDCSQFDTVGVNLSSSVNDFAFAPDGTGFAVGYSSSILRSMDNGATWVPLVSAPSTRLNAICQPVPGIATAVGVDGVIVRTTDGGESWTTQDSGVEESLAGVSFTDALHGVVVGYSGSILATTDGGAQWTPLPAPASVGFRDVAFIDELHGTVIGYDGAIFGTRDGGQTWTDFRINTLADMRAVTFRGDTGVIVGEFGYILLSFDGGRQSWNTMSRGIRQEELWEVHFTDDTHGVTVGTKGSVLHTTDAGETWKGFYSSRLGGSAFLADVWCFDHDRWHALDLRGRIYRTTNAGGIWAAVETGSAGDLSAFCYSDDLTGTAVGDDGIILRTTDAGISWERQTTPTTQVLMGVAFSGHDLGIAVGNRVALRTLDGGRNWNIIPGLDSEYMNEVAFYGEGYVLIAGAGGKVYRSSDNGSSWTDVSPARGRQFHGIAFRNALNGLIAGDGGALFRTRDGGLTWTEEEPDTGNRLLDVAFTPSGTAIVVGSNGTIMRRSLGGTSAVTDTHVPPRAFRLEQNSPNPFNPVTTLRYTLPRSAHVTLTVFDLFGREVRRLLDGSFEQPGSHQVQFDAEGLPSGVYLYSVSTGGQRQTRKMLLLR